MCEKHRVDTVWNLDVAKFMFLLGLETNYRRTSYFEFLGTIVTNHENHPKNHQVCASAQPYLPNTATDQCWAVL